MDKEEAKLIRMDKNAKIPGRPIKIYTLKFEVSQEEFDLLEKQHEEDRLEELMYRRYEFHVLYKAGKIKSVPVMKRMMARQIIRFCATFVKIGMGAL